MADRARVAVLISGSGTNMAALLYASRLADCPFELVLVASNDPDAPGLAIARAEGVPVWAESHKGVDRAAFDSRLLDAIDGSGAQFVALAGYMRLLSPGFVARWAGKLVNIHPSLLPAHKGLGTHANVLAAGETRTGASVHLVTDELDSGELLGQVAVAVHPGDTPERLAARVLIAEHQLYPATLAKFVLRDRDPVHLLERLRECAFHLAQVDEVVSHGMACFGVSGGKKFAYLSSDHHGDGRTAVLVKISGAEEQATLIENDPGRYYRPAYFGDGWVGIRLDLGDTDWNHIADWLQRSWRSVAPKKLTALMDAADMF